MGAKAIVSLDAGKCIFCGNDQKQFKLRAFESLDSDKNVRQIATELGDTGLLAKIAAGDLISIGSKYHLNCLADLRIRYELSKGNRMNSPQTLKKANQERIKSLSRTKQLTLKRMLRTVRFSLSLTIFIRFRRSV